MNYNKDTGMDEDFLQALMDKLSDRKKETQHRINVTETPALTDYSGFSLQELTRLNLYLVKEVVELKDELRKLRLETRDAIMHTPKAR